MRSRRTDPGLAPAAHARTKFYAAGRH